MPRPATKAQLLGEIEREHDALEALLRDASAEQLVQPGVIGEWSIKDVLAHLSEWEQMLRGWYAAGKRGETPELPAPGYSWGQLRQLNQAIYERHRERDLESVVAQFADSYQATRQLVTEMAEEELLGPGHYRWTGKHPLVAYVVPNTSEHYSWARKAIRKWLRARQEPRAGG